MINLLERLLELLEKSPNDRVQRAKITDERKTYLKSIKTLRAHLKSDKES